MKILCFSAHTSIWLYTFAEALISYELQKRGNNVFYITSNEGFNRCRVCLNANGFSSTSNSIEIPIIKKLGIANEKIVRKEFGLSGYDIGSKLDNEDRNNISTLMKKLNRNNFSKFRIDGIDLGKISLYEFLLANKKMTTDIDKREWEEVKTYLKNTLTSYFSSKKIIDLEKPDAILIYADLYSINNAWIKCAEYNKVPIYFIHQGLNLSDFESTLIVAKCNSIDYFNNLKALWFKFRSIPVSRANLGDITDHFLELLKAKHALVYSEPKSIQDIDIRKIFNIKNDQKILTATMSSFDEMLSANYVGAWKIPNKLIFANQVDWIKALVNYVKKRKNLFLLIRVHPRDFPNKRDDLKSDHAKMLEKILKTLPDNVKINWPTDQISIYDLAKDTDVFLNAWSTAGVEMSLLGIPVVLYSKDLVLYPAELNYVAKNYKNYFAQIEKALKDGWSFEKIIMTYRWLALYYCYPIIKFRKKRKTTGTALATYNLIPNSLKPLFKKIYFSLFGLKINKDKINECIRQQAEHVEISKVEKMLARSGDTMVDLKEVLKNKATSKDEKLYLKNEIKRLYAALFASTRSKLSVESSKLQVNLHKAAYTNEYI